MNLIFLSHNILYYSGFIYKINKKKVKSTRPLAGV